MIRYLIALRARLKLGKDLDYLSSLAERGHKYARSGNAHRELFLHENRPRWKLIQRELSFKLKKIYPLALCEIRMFEILGERRVEKEIETQTV